MERIEAQRRLRALPCDAVLTPDHDSAGTDDAEQRLDPDARRVKDVQRDRREVELQPDLHQSVEEPRPARWPGGLVCRSSRAWADGADAGHEGTIPGCDQEDAR